MECRYTVDPTSDEPIMLLDDEIGYDPETRKGIPADQFCRELMYLDTLNKSKINIWINSVGGMVVDGMQIFNTILKTKTKIDTHNVGMAASIAAPIFLAGRNRYMMDNAVLMVHPVSGGDNESLKVFENCVNTMISSRSYLTPERIQAMMNATTWLDASQCESLGLCIKESSSEFNKQRSKPDLSDVKNAHRAYREIVNNAINNLKPKKMKNITNKLDLNEDANETSIVRAIDSIQNKAKEAEALVNNLRSELKNKETEISTLKNQVTEFENKVKDFEKQATEAKNKAIETEAETEINQAIKLGKIENKAEVIEKWKNNYKTNPEGTKEMLASIPVNKKAPSIVVNSSTTGKEDELTMTAAMKMNELRNKFKL